MKSTPLLLVSLWLPSALWAGKVPCATQVAGTVSAPAIQALTVPEATAMNDQGFTVRPAFFGEGFSREFIADMKRLEAEGKLVAFKDRIVDGRPTEVGFGVGPW